MATKSLGTLTLDLVAQTGGFIQGMDKAERASKKWRKEVQDNLRQTSKQLKAGLAVSAAAAGAAIAGLGAATIKLTQDGLQNIDAQNKLARSIDGTFDSVTALKIAFSENGVDGYEMSLARLNRRLGAAENGSGEASKTVEALNLNLKELSGLDADERMARIADAIVDSGASAQQAARYAQQLGFEQKEAAQMFMQGGDAIRAYRQQVEDFGLAVSTVDAIKVEQANDAFARTGLVFDAISQQLAVQVAPILSGISEMFVQNAKDAGGIGEATADAFNMVIEGSAEAVNRIAVLNRWFLRGQAAADVFALHVRNGFLEIAREIVEIPTGAVNELIGMLNLVGADIKPLGLSDIGRGVQGLIDGTKAEIATINKELAAELNKPLPGDQFKRFVFEARQAAEESAQAMAAIQSGINDSAGGGAPLGSSEDVAEDMAKRRTALLTSLETEKQAILRAFGERDEEIAELRQAQAITEMEANNARLQNERAMYEALDAMRQEDADRERQAVEARLSAAADIVSITSTQMQQMEGLYGEMGVLGEAFFVMSQGLAAANAVIQGIQSAMAIRVAYAQLAAITANPGLLGAGEVHANLAQAMGVAASVGIAAQTVASFEGGGYTGAGVRAGGLDGKGGFMAMLHPNETVIDHNLKLDSILASQRGGSGNVEIHNYGDNQVRTRRGSDGQLQVIIEAVDNHLVRGMVEGSGKVNHAMQKVYSLTRKGY